MDILYNAAFDKLSGGCTVAERLELLSHSKKVQTLAKSNILREDPTRVSMGSLRVFRLAPAAQSHARLGQLENLK